MGKRLRQICYTKSMVLHNWFLPHKDTHNKAHLISWQALFFYVCLFIFLQVGFSIISYTKPGVLGISANLENLDQKKIIELTNTERQKLGLSPVSENEELDKAASAKADNMFTENYWAHFAPSGKSPWDFILGAGYRFTFAGENLAKNFYSSDDVVKAWMNSPSHRENLLNSKYKDIGIAVKMGVLNGQNTVLVVQEFGTTQNIANKPAVNVSGKQVAVPNEDFSKPVLFASVSQYNLNTKPLLDPYLFFKYAGISLVSFMVLLLAVDILVLYKRGVLRISSHYMAHMSILSISAVSIITSHQGSIL